ncbi:type I restriction-modification system subunit M [Marivirga harenae]|uniref:type I restriction-modification system subunit M n=1 Tax=Marivirga harenae TaxID=2010992 RepID=UPI0026DEE089|nr:class I SAM-dependent DNA methyltransferase [Marivirga harenae]WKV12193.1 class I SAM-dependent DNA methyltransferase [Marivirga harenae]
MTNFSQTANLIWDIAELLRGDFKQSDYGKVILPLTVIRRLDCVLEPTKDKVLEQYPKVQAMDVQNIDPILNNKSGYNFHNHSKYDFDKLVADPENIAQNLNDYIAGFSENARDIIEHFSFDVQIAKLEEHNLLFMVVKRFQEVDLHPDVIDNTHMGYLYEELIRRFSELSNETAGEHYSPREIIRLMVNILFLNDRDILTKKGVVKTAYDVCAGTGGMLSVAEEYLHELNPDARLEVFGQELNPESYAICKSDMMVKAQSTKNIALGNSLSKDVFPNKKFDYLLTNPPFGVQWKKVQKEIKEEHKNLGFSGRFGAGLPRVSDGSLLFLMHLISKMKQDEEGSRIGIVLNGSPLFTGSAGSGESDIRKWIIENDMLESVVALPDQIFYNTGIYSYLWFLTNRKEKHRKGKVQLINAVDLYKKMGKSLGNKRHVITDEQIEELTQIYGAYQAGEHCKIFDNEDFGYTRITIERPERDKDGEIITNKKGEVKVDTSLRDTEDVPLKEDIEEYFEREVKPHVPDAWINHSKSKVGYEINFTRYFYEYKPLRNLEDIRADILALEEVTEGMIKEVLD